MDERLKTDEIDDIITSGVRLAAAAAVAGVASTSINGSRL